VWISDYPVKGWGWGRGRGWSILTLYVSFGGRLRDQENSFRTWNNEETTCSYKTYRQQSWNLFFYFEIPMSLLVESSIRNIPDLIPSCNTHKKVIIAIITFLMWCKSHANSTNCILIYTKNVVCIKIPAFCTAARPWCRQHVECPLQHRNFICTWHYFLYFWGSQNFILQVCIIPFPALIMKQNYGCENHTHDLASNCRQDLQYINISAFWDVYSCLWEVKISYN
jgi:hypothetical protein